MDKIITVKEVDFDQLAMELSAPPTLFGINQAICVERIDTNEYFVYSFSKKVLPAGDTIPFGTLIFKVIEEVARADVRVEWMDEVDRGIFTCYRAKRQLEGETHSFVVREVEYVCFDD